MRRKLPPKSVIPWELRVAMETFTIEKELFRLERIYHRPLTRDELNPILKILMKCPSLSVYWAWRLAKCGQ